MQDGAWGYCAHLYQVRWPQHTGPIDKCIMLQEYFESFLLMFWYVLHGDTWCHSISLQMILKFLKAVNILQQVKSAATFVSLSPPHSCINTSPKANKISLWLKGIKTHMQLLHVCPIYGPPAAEAAAGMCLSAELPWSSYSSYGRARVESSQITFWTSNGRLL